MLDLAALLRGITTGAPTGAGYPTTMPPMGIPQMRTPPFMPQMAPPPPMFPDPMAAGPMQTTMPQAPPMAPVVNSGMPMPMADPNPGMEPGGAAPPGGMPMGASSSGAQGGFLQNLLAKLQDPNVMAAIGQTGMGLLQSPEFGQNGWDVASNSLQRGVSTLQQLRERDRLLSQQAMDRQTAEEQRQFENKAKTRELEGGEEKTNIYGQQVRQQGEASSSSSAVAEGTLRETGRHNRQAESVDRTNAESARIRAETYKGLGGGGSTSGDAFKIKNLAAAYVQNDGLDEVDALARATMVVQTQGKTKDSNPSSLAMELVKTKVQAYQSDIGNWSKPLTQAMIQQFQKDSIDDAIKLYDVDKKTKGAAGNAPPAAPSSGPGRSPTGLGNQAPMTFATEAQAMAAEKAGRLKKGAKVVIGGKPGTWN